MAKLGCLVPSISGFALNPGAFITVHSDLKLRISSFDGLINMVSENKFAQGCSFTTVIDSL